VIQQVEAGRDVPVWSGTWERPGRHGPLRAGLAASRGRAPPLPSPPPPPPPPPCEQVLFEPQPHAVGQRRRAEVLAHAAVERLELLVAALHHAAHEGAHLGRGKEAARARFGGGEELAGGLCRRWERVRARRRGGCAQGRVPLQRARTSLAEQSFWKATSGGVTTWEGGEGRGRPGGHGAAWPPLFPRQRQRPVWKVPKSSAYPPKQPARLPLPPPPAASPASPQTPAASTACPTPVGPGGGRVGGRGGERQEGTQSAQSGPSGRKWVDALYSQLGAASQKDAAPALAPAPAPAARTWMYCVIAPSRSASACCTDSRSVGALRGAGGQGRGRGRRRQGAVRRACKQPAAQTRAPASRGPATPKPCRSIPCSDQPASQRIATPHLAASGASSSAKWP
jgi:hypothetical protein